MLAERAAMILRFADEDENANPVFSMS